MPPKTIILEHVCRMCRKIKLLGDFYPSRILRYDWVCKPCLRIERNKYGKRNVKRSQQ